MAIAVRQRACRRVILSFVVEFLPKNVKKTWSVGRARTKPRPAYCSSPKQLHSIHGVVEARVFCSLSSSLLRSLLRQIRGERAHKLFGFVSSSVSSETLLGLAIAPPLPNEHSWLKLKAASEICDSMVCSAILESIA